MDDMSWRKASASQSNGHCVEVAWRKASVSVNNGQCVEAASSPGAVLVRDSKNPHTGFLSFTPDQWMNFVAVLKRQAGA